jgi:hypothetical protein
MAKERDRDLTRGILEDYGITYDLDESFELAVLKSP